MPDGYKKRAPQWNVEIELDGPAYADLVKKLKGTKEGELFSP